MKYIFTTLFCFSLLSVFAQPLPAKFKTWIDGKQIFNVELGGLGGYYSLNYELVLLEGKYGGLSQSVGYTDFNRKGIFYNSFIYRDLVYIHLYKNIKLEVGLNFTRGRLIYRTPDDLGTGEYQPYTWEVDIEKYVDFGLRYQSIKNGLFFRANVFPIIGQPGVRTHLRYLGINYEPGDKATYWWGGFTFGYKF
jgi:hypothetical protein